jgi:hypothetical protein
MKRDLLCKCHSSFLSCEKDTELILKKLFIDSHPHSEDLIRLLVINTKDCLDAKDSQVYKDVIKAMDLKTLREKGYIRLEPKIDFPEHEEVKSYLVISFDNFTTNGTNPQFRDCTVTFDIICHTDYWDLGNYRLRPLKIAGFIDGLLHNTKLTGIGTFQFMGCNELVLSDELSGYSLMFAAIHGSDDNIPPSDV